MIFLHGGSPSHRMARRVLSLRLASAHRARAALCAHSPSLSSRPTSGLMIPASANSCKMSAQAQAQYFSWARPDTSHSCVLKHTGNVAM